MHNLLEDGKIYLLKQPINGRWGVHRLFAALCGGEFGVRYDGTESVNVIMLNPKRTRLRILHADCLGYSLITRISHDGKFNTLIEGDATKVSITRAELQRLCLDGTLSGPWRNPFLLC